MKIKFHNYQSPGDIVVMTGAIRDLKKQYPEYDIAMDTSCGQIWENNPHVNQSIKNDPDIVTHKLGYDDIHNSGHSGRHFSAAYHLQIEQTLGIRLKQSEIWPDLHLTDVERSSNLTGLPQRYWILNAGHKRDFTLKHWGHGNYQRLVDMLRDRVTFVQVGEDSPGHVHLPINGAINYIGHTNNIRNFMRLLYHAEGSIGPVSMHSHIAAAFKKPCVVIAGGREPWRWEAYPNQRYMCTNGFLPCCRDNGCWKNWHYSEGEEIHSYLENWRDKVCTNEINGVSKCMRMITPEKVAEEILGYYEGVLCA